MNQATPVRRQGTIGTAGLAGITPDMRPYPREAITGKPSERMAELMAEVSALLHGGDSVAPRKVLEKMDILLRLLDMRLKELESRPIYVAPQPVVKPTIFQKIETLWRRFRRG